LKRSTRRLLFVAYLIIGNIVITVCLYLWKDVLFDSIAVFTSISTAIYAILTEPEERTEPLLKVDPVIKGGKMGAGELGLDVSLYNIGWSPAKNVQGRCKIIPENSIPLENDGKFQTDWITKEEPFTYHAIDSISSNELKSKEKIVVEITYSDLEDKKQRPITKEALISDLLKNLSG